jgi:carbamoyltransferase
MKVLGISEIDNDAGAVLMEDGKLVAAANEERFSRVKQHAGFPLRAVSWMLGSAGWTTADLDAIAIAKPALEEEWKRRLEPLKRHRWFEDGLGLDRQALDLAAHLFYKLPRSYHELRKMNGEVRRFLELHRIPAAKIVRVNHHRAHAASAYHASGCAEALAFTVDGHGEGVSGAVHLCRDSKMELLREIGLPSSLGIFYAAATRALGYRPARHEGKVTGLAAFAEPDPECLDFCREIAFATFKGYRTRCLYGSFPKMKRILKRCGPAPFAAAFQKVLEEVVTDFARPYIREFGARNLVLAGGVFSNVKLNQRMLEIEGVESVFVFPHMGDGGLGYGAAVIAGSWNGAGPPKCIEDVYWGPEFGEAEIRHALERAGASFRIPDDLEREVARLLAEGQVVARFAGRMEFGPRALGNRSILYQATDPTVNDWLNCRLSRTEFMPFAPVTIASAADGCYRNLAGAERTAEYMTITFDCTEAMKQQCPAVVHADGTARPQILREEVNPPYFRILEEYRKLTGIPSVINTSFNIHEEPIVMSPEDALRSIRLSNIEYLAIGRFLCRNR